MITKRPTNLSPHLPLLSIPPTTSPTSIQNLILTFRKLVTKSSDLNTKKIIIVIITNTKSNKSKQLQKKIYEITQAKQIKNCIACFYGESILITNLITNFTIFIYEQTKSKTHQNRNLLTEFHIDNQTLQTFSQKELYMTSNSELLDLVWEAQIQSDNINQQEQSYYMDRSLEDFDDIEIKRPQQQSRQLSTKKSFTPTLMRQGLIKNSISNIEESKLQLISESMKKLTANTTETVTNIMQLTQSTQYKKMIQNNNGNDELRKKIKTKQNLYRSFTDQQQVHHQTQLNNHNINKKSMINQQRNPNKKSAIFQHPVLNLKKNKSPPPLTHYSHTRKDLKTQRMFHSQKNIHQNGRNKMERFYHKFTFNSLLYTSVIGIIGGVTAAQL